MPRRLVLKRHGHEQTVPIDVWNITHDLNTSTPVVDVWILSNGVYINSDAHEVSVVTPNSVQIDFFGTAVKGNALIS